ncbi:formate dehydrogenase subunit delta [Thiohalorhabdus sp. Cl-TMA]|uniref:Formate dehydrogenase subunit delta n=1 Tax=Thiohalorhabdus methylotrophus TaxID=3242694 RepID=A0ABV4TX54_9GAMM
MDDTKMVHQANQIAAYFEVYPKERARQGVLDHIQKFWPSEKRAELAAFRKGGGEGMHPLVEWAADQLAEAAGEQVQG